MTGPPPPSSDPTWTVAEACSYFCESGIPCTPDQLEAIIAKLPRFPRAGQAPSGPQGGRGKTVYRVSVLMRLHSRLAEWLLGAGARPGQSTWFGGQRVSR